MLQSAFPTWSWVANNDPLDSFITFINAGTFNVIERVRFDGTDPNGANILANGIEQSVFNPRDGKFYLAIPATGTAAASKPGVIVRISANAPFKVEEVIDFAKPPLNTTVVLDRPAWRSALLASSASLAA